MVTFSTEPTAAGEGRGSGGEGLSARCEILVLSLHIGTSVFLMLVFNYLFQKPCYKFFL